MSAVSAVSSQSVESGATATISALEGPGGSGESSPGSSSGGGGIESVRNPEHERWLRRLRKQIAWTTTRTRQETTTETRFFWNDWNEHMEVLRQRQQWIPV